MTHLITCEIPDGRVSSDPPLAVTLSSQECDPSSHVLKVTDGRLTGSERKELIAVCVKPLDILDWDASARLAEWIELQLILGAHKVNKAQTGISRLPYFL